MTLAETPVAPDTLPVPEPVAEPEEHAPRGSLIICYSGDLEKTWAAMILASTAGAMGMPSQGLRDLLGPPDVREARASGSRARTGCRR